MAKRSNTSWFWDAYTHWPAEHLSREEREALRDRARPAGTENGTGDTVGDMASVFIRLKNPISLSAPSEAVKTLFQTDGLAPFQARFSDQELAAFDGTDPNTDPTAGLFVFLNRTALQDRKHRRALEKVATIVDVGPPVLLGTPLPQTVSTDTAPKTKHGTDTPIVAIIDDGIGFLNRRFTRFAADGVTLETRFDVFWLQATEQAAERDGIKIGTILSSDAINALLAKGDEARAYQSLGQTVFGPGSRQAIKQSISHGTHVLDLAAGAEPASNDPLVKTRLMGVQLPPESIA
ncbi:MAG: hypothetical protein AAGM04_12035, partial [Pseudomonadota bacterium]